MGPTGEIMAPLGPLTIEARREMFEEQARGLMAGGADVLWVETISAPEEYEAAALGIARAGAPWCGTMSFDTAGRTMMGLTSADMVALVEALPYPPLGLRGELRGGGVGPAAHRARLRRGRARALPMIAKGNAGIPKFSDGRIVYDGTPELMADYAVLARDCGARIIGGCCGTTPAHLARDARGAGDGAAGAAARPRDDRGAARRVLLGVATGSAAASRRRAASGGGGGAEPAAAPVSGRPATSSRRRTSSSRR